MKISYEKNQIIGTEFIDFLVKPNICYLIPRKHELLFENERNDIQPKYKMSKTLLTKLNYELKLVLPKEKENNDKELEELIKNVENHNKYFSFI